MSVQSEHRFSIDVQELSDDLARKLENPVLSKIVGGIIAGQNASSLMPTQHLDKYSDFGDFPDD